jgi:hypothetical protein
MGTLMSSAAKWMKRELRDLRDYMPKMKERGVVDESLDRLAKCGTGEHELATATRALSYLAYWYGGRGAIAVLDGDDSGYELVDRACLYNFCAIRILSRGYDLDPRPNKQSRGLLMDRIATCWMHADAVGATAIREELDRLVMRVDEGYGGVGGRDMNGLATLVAHYATGRDFAMLERSGWSPIEVYSTAIRGITEPDWEELAAYHARNVDGAAYPAFHAYPYRVAAFEILAIARRTGGAVSGQHPLITSPLIRARDVGRLAVPDELAPLISRAAREWQLEPIT